MNEIIPQDYARFCISSKEKGSIEAMAICSTCTLNKIPYNIVGSYKNVLANYIPVGDIEFVENVLGKHIKPNYYPEYLKKYLQRKIWTTSKWPLGKRVFIKPSDKYKRFTGFITNGGYKGKKPPPYVCSEIINFVNEWRYYICLGEVICSGWYAGKADTEIPAPDLDIVFESSLCCCLDMGENQDGQLILVEQQAPFACGWYGKTTPAENEKYTKWIAHGWDYLKKLAKN